MSLRRGELQFHGPLQRKDRIRIRKQGKGFGEVGPFNPEASPELTLENQALRSRCIPRSPSSSKAPRGIGGISPVISQTQAKEGSIPSRIGRPSIPTKNKGPQNAQLLRTQQVSQGPDLSASAVLPALLVGQGRRREILRVGSQPHLAKPLFSDSHMLNRLDGPQ